MNQLQSSNQINEPAVELKSDQWSHLQSSNPINEPAAKLKSN
jgi:hypothetical protein